MILSFSRNWPSRSICWRDSSIRTESRISLAVGGAAAGKAATVAPRRRMISRIVLDLFKVSTNHLSLTLPNGSAAFSSHQRAMDEPGPGFVHGCAQRRRRLEAAPPHRPFCRSHLWRIQGAGLHFLFTDHDLHCSADHEHTEVGDQSKTTKARGFDPHGPTGERAAGAYVDLQKTGGAPFGRIRPEAR